MKTQKPIVYRQGDVAIRRVDSLPTGLKKVPRQSKRVVLASGNATGHAHFFDEAIAEKLTAKDGAEFFRVGGTMIKGRLPIQKRWRSQVLAQHPKLGPIEFRVDDVKIDGDTAIVVGEFGLLRHNFLTGAPTATPDHNTQALPAGIYRGANAGGMVGQSEYNREEVRRVID